MKLWQWYRVTPSLDPAGTPKKRKWHTQPAQAQKCTGSHPCTDCKPSSTLPLHLPAMLCSDPQFIQLAQLRASKQLKVLCVALSTYIASNRCCQLEGFKAGCRSMACHVAHMWHAMWHTAPHAM
jgi:hypothetical protein